MRNLDVEDFKTESTTTEPPSTPPTQPSAFNATTIPEVPNLIKEFFKTKPTIALNVTTIPNNVTQAPNISMNNTTSTIQPWTAPNKPRKKSELPNDKIRYFNPDGPALDFLAKGGQISIFQVKERTHVIVLSGLGTLILTFHWFL